MINMPEKTNKIITAGLQVSILHTLHINEACERIRADPELINLSDEALQALIEDARQYWYEKAMHSDPDAAILIVYPTLIEVCASERLINLGELSKGIDAEEKKAIDVRRARWIEILSRCLIDRGMLALYIGAKSAWEVFLKAAMMARSLPDDGQLRLREVMWACYGQYTAARIGKQAELIQMAEEELVRLMHLPQREAEALNYLNEIQEEFKHLKTTFHKVKVLPETQKFLLKAKLDAATSPVLYGELCQDIARHYLTHQTRDTSSPVLDLQHIDPLQLLDEKVVESIKLQVYISLINYYGVQMMTGELPSEVAELHLQISISDGLLSYKEVYFLAEFHNMLNASDPERAIPLARLNYIASHVIEVEKSPALRPLCAFVLGRAWYLNAGKQTTNAESYQQAFPYLKKNYQQAIPYLEETLQNWPFPDLDLTTEVFAMLVSCYRDTGYIEKALELSYKNLELLLTLPDPNSAQRIRTAIVYGNLASVQEQLNHNLEALENHYKAFQIFLTEKDTQRTQQALHYLSMICNRVGRLDIVIAAWEKAAQLQMELGNFLGAVQAYLALVGVLLSTLRYEKTFDILDRVQNLLQPFLSSEIVNEKFLRPYYELLMYKGMVYWLIARLTHSSINNIYALGDALSSSQEITTQDIVDIDDQRLFIEMYNSLERARGIAIHLGEPDQLVRAVILLANVCNTFQRFDLVEYYNGMIDLIPCQMFFHIAQHEILGEMYFYQQRYQDAIDCFQKALAAYSPEYREQRRQIFFKLGRAYEASNDILKAISSYESSLAIFEETRLMLYEESRMSVMSSSLAIYNHLIALYTNNQWTQYEVYNPERAWYWLEKSKSRTFVESLGLSNIILKDPADDIKIYLEEEQALLQELNQKQMAYIIRNTDTTDSADIQQNIHFTMEQLNTIWDQLAIHYPEYVELRRGSTANWSTIQNLLV